MNILGIDLGSTQTCVILTKKNFENDKEELTIIGYGKSKTQGVKKGAITNIELAAKSIQQAVANVQMMSGVQHFDKVVVSISGAYTRYVESPGLVINPNGGEIGIKEIQRAVLDAKIKANIPNGYEIIHVLPYNFKVNDIDYVEDPLGMSGKRLEVSTHIVISQEAHIKNLKKAVELADLKVSNLVLSGYASAIACLDESEKELGTILIDMGGAICDIVIHLGNSIRYNECLQIGSLNITQDLSIALHTPLKEAENIKLSYANLGQEPEKIIQVPSMGDESKVVECNLGSISTVIYSRAEETLMLLAKILSETQLARSAGAGVVLTGGMTKLAGLDKLATAIFDKKAVRIASARDNFISSFDEVLKDPEYTCVVGLCLYEAGYFTPYELDSNQRLRCKGEEMLYNEPIKQEFTPIKEEKNEILNENSQENDTIAVNENLLELTPKKEKESPFLKIWHKIVNQF